MKCLWLIWGSEWPRNVDSIYIMLLITVSFLNCFEVLQNFWKIQILGLSDLILARSVDRNIVINDGILVTGGIHSQHNSLLFRASVFSFIHIIPTVWLGFFWNTSSLIFTQFLDWLGLHQHSVNWNGFLLRTIEYIGCLLIKDYTLSVDITTSYPAQAGGQGDQCGQEPYHDDGGLGGAVDHLQEDNM